MVLTGGGEKADIVLPVLFTAPSRLCLFFKLLLCGDLEILIP